VGKRNHSSSKVQVVYDVTPYRMVNIHQHLGTDCCLHLQDQAVRILLDSFWRNNL